MMINHKEKNKVVEKREAQSLTNLLCSLWVCLLIIIASTCFAQQKINSDSVIHYKVKYSNNDYVFLPADNYLFVGGKNKITITNTKGKPFEVKLINGNIKKIQGDSVFEIEGLVNMGKALLSIYETDANGKRKPVLNKPYSVITYPIVKFGGVASDSAMPVIMLAAGGMYANYKSLNTKVPVTGFKMEFYENGKFTLDSSLNNRLSKKMLAYVGKLKPGSMVYFTEIKYKNPNGSEETAPIFRVFIIKQKDVTSFGM